MLRIIRCLSLLLFLPAFSFADDWPQWFGPQRDGIWREKGVLKNFPKDGPQVLWRTPIHWGYSGPAAAEGKIYVTDYVQENGKVTNNPGARDKMKGQERILCLDAQTGKMLWKYTYERDYSLSYPKGPRCTPTVDSGKVYCLGAEGDLLCLDADNGEVLWSKELTKAYKTSTPIWGYAAHPLVDGDLLYCIVGGENSLVVAFDKNTGKEVWKALSTTREQGYCPPTIIEHDGVRQLLIWHPDSLNSLNPKTGEKYWSTPLRPSYQMAIAPPRKLGDYLFASGIGHVGAMMKLGKKDGRPSVEVLWKGTAKSAVYSGNSTPFLEDGMIYGADCGLGALIGAKIEDGKRVWETFQPTTGGTRRASHGTAFLVKHQDRFFLWSETGDLILAKLSPKGYQELGRFHVLEPTNDSFGRPVVWSYPAFANRCAYVRNDKEIVCVSLAE